VSRGHFAALRAALEGMDEVEGSRIDSWGRHLAGVLDAGGRLLACGNGGSAAEAQHLTSELVGRYLHDRRPLSAIDLLIALSTSGTSRNVVAAAKAAHEIGMTAWALTGPAPNTLAAVCDDAIAVEAPSIATVQEIHLAVVHALCAAVDDALGVVAPQAPL
jgi:D-sedoheptulose 7-phosphate isomerase